LGASRLELKVATLAFISSFYAYKSMLEEHFDNYAENYGVYMKGEEK